MVRNIRKTFGLLFSLPIIFNISVVNGTTVRYVDINSTNPTIPFISMQTAATNIQEVLDVSSDGDEILVFPGVFVNVRKTNIIPVITFDAITWTNSIYTLQYSTDLGDPWYNCTNYVSFRGANGVVEVDCDIVEVDSIATYRIIGFSD